MLILKSNSDERVPLPQWVIPFCHWERSRTFYPYPTDGNTEEARPNDLSNLWVVSVSQAGSHNFQISS